MKLCACLERWTPDTEPPVAAPVKNVALPWPAIAEHCPPRDTSGRTLMDALTARGLRLQCLELSPLTCLEQDAVARQIDEARRQMKIAGRLGAAVVIISSAHRGSVGLEMTITCLGRLAAMAEPLDLQLCVRNVCGSAVEQLDALHVLFREVRSPVLRLCLDNVEFQQAAVNPADAALCFADRMGAVRLGDRSPRSACRLGDGVAHVQATLEALAAEHFEGPLLVGAEQLADAMQRFGNHVT